jgi:hypothetical protein
MTGAPGSNGSYVDLAELQSGLTIDEVYRWRARIVSPNPYFPRSPWLSMPRSTVQEWDFRTDCPDLVWHRDLDGDGYGHPGVVIIDCIQPDGYVSDSTDCNDSQGNVNPGQPEVLCDAIDNDCDPLGTPDAPDPDGDGVDSCSVGDPGNTDGIGVDNCPTGYNPSQTDFDGDSIGDVCDNCPEVSNPGQGNADGDQLGDECDCAPSDLHSWEIPSEVPWLSLSHSGGVGGDTTLSWSAADMGAIFQRYDVGRSTDSASFSPSVCVAQGVGSIREAVDSVTPASTVVHFFLVAAENDCGYGSAGQNTAGVERAFSCL